MDTSASSKQKQMSSQANSAPDLHADCDALITFQWHSLSEHLNKGALGSVAVMGDAVALKHGRNNL